MKIVVEECEESSICWQLVFYYGEGILLVDYFQKAKTIIVTFDDKMKKKWHLVKTKRAFNESLKVILRNSENINATNL